VNSNLLLNINPQAWAILQGVLYHGEEYPDVDAYAWYNCRERGIVLVQTLGRPGRCLFVAFAEARSSDGIVVYHWEGGRRPNPPTVSDVPKKAWDSRKDFPFMRVDKAVKYILKILVDYV
jgi:hypothetical protein